MCIMRKVCIRLRGIMENTLLGDIMVPIVNEKEYIETI